MASYATRADIEAQVGADLLIRVADLDQDGAEDMGAVARAIADVDATISSRLALRWPAYIGVSTPVLRPIAVDLIIDRLARGTARTDDIRQRGQAALAALADLAAGRAVPDAAEASVTAEGAGDVQMSSTRRAFQGGGF